MVSYSEKQLNRLFWGIAIDLQEAIKDKLSDLDIKFTGSGMASVQVVVEKDKLVITMNDYLEYIEYGMPNPTSPEELREWVEQKLFENYQGKNKERAISLASENIAEKISHFGPRPRPFVRPVLHTELPRIIQKNVAQMS